MAKTITIRFMRKNDNSMTDSPEFGTRPVIPVTIRPSSPEDHAKDIGGKTKQVFALIDTGADDFYVDEALVEELTLPIKKESEPATVISGLNNEKTTIHHAIIRLIDTDIECGITMHKIITSKLGLGYQIILGMDIIRRGTLVLDPVNHIYTLTLPDVI
ncbi:retroviral-like aspartic protease family protein [Klebsiella sp. I138]|uniref:retroviral-like aspartic protease family protein n=1 Tax=Klebsiella sp. I138 TaxID=2755385 RepID=UPI003DA8D72E